MNTIDISSFTILQFAKILKIYIKLAEINIGGIWYVKRSNIVKKIYT